MTMNDNDNKQRIERLIIEIFETNQSNLQDQVFTNYCMLIDGDKASDIVNNRKPSSEEYVSHLENVHEIMRGLRPFYASLKEEYSRFIALLQSKEDCGIN